MQYPCVILSLRSDEWHGKSSTLEDGGAAEAHGLIQGGEILLHLRTPPKTQGVVKYSVWM
jgi:hypothetical protein